MTAMEDQIAPEFALAVRGYDRLQVDEYVTELRGWMAEAEARQAWAESAVAERDTRIAALEAQLGELRSEHAAASPAAVLDEAAGHVKDAIESALAAAETIKANADAGAREVLEEARDQAKIVIEAARASVAELGHAAKTDRIAAATAHTEAVKDAELAAETMRRAAVSEADSIVTAAEARRDQVAAEAEEHHAMQQREIDRLAEEHHRVVTQLADLRVALEGLISAPAAVLAAVDRIAVEDVRREA